MVHGFVAFYVSSKIVRFNKTACQMLLDIVLIGCDSFADITSFRKF